MIDAGLSCERFGDSGLVCEAHDEQAWLVEGEPCCDAPGVPCFDCNPAGSPDDPPEVSRIMVG